MIPNADEALAELMKKDKKIKEEYTKYKKLSNDPRITKVGKVIRHASIDEFPQFINVLKGEMSLIGPRPYLFRERDEMGEYFNKIVSVRPGLSGYWQVRGRSNTDFKTRLKMDEYYALNRDLELDVKIFFKTFATVLGSHGAK